MNVFQRIHSVFSQTAYEKYVKAWYAGEDVSSGSLGVVQKETALRYSAFFACNRVLAETFASVGLNEYKVIGAKGDREKTDDTGLYPIFKYAPNDETSPYNFQECMMYQINIGGNFLAERLMNGRRLAGLVQIPWESYNIYRDPKDRKLKYKVVEGAATNTLTRGEVLHIPGPSVEGVVGMSLLSYAALAIGLGLTYDTFGKKFYENGATPTGAFETPRMLKDAAYTRLYADIKDKYTGLKNSGKPMLLEDGLTYKPLTINPIDAELLGSRKFQIEDICRFFRVQPHLIQHLEKSTNNNIEQQSLEFVMYTMLPHFKRVENNINSQLLTPEQRAKGYYMEFNMASLLRGDQQSVAASLSTGLQNGYLSVNDARRMLNMNSIEGGDEYLRPLNMEPIGTKKDMDNEEAKEDDELKAKVHSLVNEAIKKGNI